MVIKSRRMTWAGYVARMGKMRNVYKSFAGVPEGKAWEPLSVDERMILKWV
jgi:hypothetical protein